MKRKAFFTFVFLAAWTVRGFSQTLVIQVKPPGSNLWGYANLKGEMIIPAQFQLCNSFSKDGYAVIYDKKKKQYSFIDLKGDRLKTEVTDFRMISILTLNIEGFQNGLVPIKIGELWGFLSKSGKVAIQPKYDYVTGFNQGHAVAMAGSTFYALDTAGQEFPVEAAGAIEIKHFSEGLAPYRTVNKRAGFIDAMGLPAITAQFEASGYFVNGLAWARAYGMVGYINPKGEWVVKPQFQIAKEFDLEGGLALVKLADRWCYVKMSGEIVRVDDTEVWGDFSEGLAAGKKGEMKGFYNNKGEWVIKPQFEGVRDFKNGYAAARQGGQWGLIDKNGNWVIKPTFEGIRDLEMVD
jgi:hypothetical protein